MVTSLYLTFNTLGLLICNGITTYAVFMGVANKDALFFDIISILYVNFSYSAFFMFITIVDYLIYERFRELNCCFKHNFATSDDERREVQKHLKAYHIQVVTNLTKNYEILRKACENFINTYFLQREAVYVGYSILAIFTSYAIFRKFVLHDSDWYLLLCVSALAGLHAIFMFIGTAIPSLIVSEGKSTAILVHNAINCIHDEQMIDNVCIIWIDITTYINIFIVYFSYSISHSSLLISIRS